MSIEDIIRMAREAGAKGLHLCTDPEETTIAYRLDFEQLERFAKLVAADAIAKEREACAKVCNAEKRWWDGMSNSEKDIHQALDNVSAVIRARGQQ